MNLGRDLKRVAGVFFSPVATFRDIGASPSWLVPAVIILLVSFVGAKVAIPYVDWDRTVRNTFESRGMEFSEEQVQKIVDQQKWVGETLGPWLGPVWVIVMLLALALIYWGGINAFGGRIGFRTSSSVALYGWLPKLVESFLFMVLIRGKEPMVADRLTEVVTNSPVAFLGESASPMLRAFAGCFNVFTLWALGVTGLGLSEAGKVSRGLAYTLLGILFAVNIALWVGLSAITGR